MVHLVSRALRKATIPQKGHSKDKVAHGCGWPDKGHLKKGGNTSDPLKSVKQPVPDGGKLPNCVNVAERLSRDRTLPAAALGG